MRQKAAVLQHANYFRQETRLLEIAACLMYDTINKYLVQAT
jgi:hypothetical protein